MNIARFAVCTAIVSLIGVGVLLTIAAVGKPRRPLTGSVAVGVTVLNGLVIAGVLYLYGSTS